MSTNIFTFSLIITLIFEEKKYIYNSELTVFPLHFKDVIQLQNYLHCFWWKFSSHSNSFFYNCIFLFFLAKFKIFTFTFSILQFTYNELRCDFFEFIILGLHWVSWISRLIILNKSSCIWAITSDECVLFCISFSLLFLLNSNYT